MLARRGPVASRGQSSHSMTRASLGGRNRAPATHNEHGRGPRPSAVKDHVSVPAHYPQLSCQEAGNQNSCGR